MIKWIHVSVMDVGGFAKNCLPAGKGKMMPVAKQ